MKRSIANLGLAMLALSGCAKKPVPVSAGTDTDKGTIYATPGEQSAPFARRIGQADLIAAAGSDRVFFPVDSSTLTDEAEAMLGRQVEWLLAHPQISFTIEGHCDERGTRDYNLGLGERRAAAVAIFMSTKGIGPERLRTISYGKERPQATGSDEAAYGQNRRAVSVVIDGARQAGGASALRK